MSGFELDPGVISLTDQIRCVSRELALRRRVYPRFVGSGRMKPEEAEREIERMQAVLHTLQELAGR